MTSPCSLCQRTPEQSWSTDGERLLHTKIGVLLRDGSWIDRRVSTLTIDDLDEDSITVSRRVSISVNHARLRELLGGPTPDESPYLIPLGLFHKDLLLDFDVTDQTGGSLVAISREREATFATQFAMSCVPAERPSHIIFTRVRRYISSLRGQPAPFRSFRDQLTAISTSVAYSDTDRAWATLALQTARFLNIIDILREHHVLIVSVPSIRNDLVLKVRRREAVPDSSAQSTQRYSTSRVLRFEIADYGWPISDHVRVAGQTGTNVTGLWPRSILAAAQGRYDYVVTGNTERRALYHFNPPRVDVDVSSPRRRPIHTSFLAIVRPAPLGRDNIAIWLVGFIVLALVFGAAAELAAVLRDYPGPLSTGSNAETLTTLTFVTATIFLAYVFRQEENPVRELLLRSLRKRIGGFLGFPWIACALLMTPKDMGPDWGLGASWLILGIAAAFAYFWFLKPVYANILDSETPYSDEPQRLTVEIRRERETI